ncbi:MAG: type II toxin-antitoxin system MqsA family antitoxin [Verrucomicrobiota bacterium]
MKKSQINEMEQKAHAVMRGEKAPSRSWELSQKADGSWERVAIDPKTAQLDRARAWEAKSRVAKIRAKLNLTQTAFADLLGIPVKTLRKWEGEETKPSGPAQTLLKIAERRPDVLLELQEA